MIKFDIKKFHEFHKFHSSNILQLFLFLPFFRIAGNAAFILGSILEDPTGRRKTMHLLQDEKHADDTSYLLPSLTALIQTHEPEAMTNASGTLSLLVYFIFLFLSYFVFVSPTSNWA